MNDVNINHNITDEELIEGMSNGTIKVRVVRESRYDGCLSRKAEFIKTDPLYPEKEVFICYVETQSIDVLKMAISKNGFTLLSIKNPTREMYKHTLFEYPFMLRNIDESDRTIENCLFAIKSLSQPKYDLYYMLEVIGYIPSEVKSNQEFRRKLIDLGLFLALDCLDNGDAYD